MKLSVIIVSYNVRIYLDQCLDSVSRALNGIDGEVFVVDNNSTDDTLERLSVKYPWVHFISNNENVGFAIANNQAIRLSSGEYVLLLNPDTIVGEGTFREVIDTLDSRQDVAGAGVRMLKTNGEFALESRRGIPTPFTAFCKMSGLGRMFPNSRKYGRYYMQYLDENRTEEIEIISGACMFIRRTALDEAGLLDEDFFMYGEDIDLSYRLLKTGRKNLYVPSTILHYKGESTKKGSFKYVNAFYQAMLIFFRKHFSEYSFIMSVPIKCAILGKGFVDFVWHKFRNMFDRHDTLYYIRKSRFLLLCSPENKTKMEEKCDGMGITYTTVVSTSDIIERGHLAVDMEKIGGCDYVVYDMSVFSYHTMLEAFRQALKEKSSPQIGTYFSDDNVLITGSAVF